MDQRFRHQFEPTRLAIEERIATNPQTADLVIAHPQEKAAIIRQLHLLPTCLACLTLRCEDPVTIDTLKTRLLSIQRTKFRDHALPNCLKTIGLGYIYKALAKNISAQIAASLTLIATTVTIGSSEAENVELVNQTFQARDHHGRRDHLATARLFSWWIMGHESQAHLYEIDRLLYEFKKYVYHVYSDAANNIIYEERPW